MPYKPTSIDYSDLQCVVFADRETLSETQRADFAQGCSAMSAFWAAAEADAFWRDMGQWPVNRCIFVALCVRDILRAVGRVKAVEFRTGVEVRNISGEVHRSLGIGMPNAPVIENSWNAHMTVRLGDVLLDPTHGQTKRDWNNSPYAAAFLINNGPQRLNIDKDFDVYPSVLHYYWSSMHHFRVAYFGLNRAVDLRTRRWLTSPDARPDRRLRLVTDAVAIYRDTKWGS